MNVDTAILNRRTIRAFTNEPVADELLREILTLAARAPSNGNLQPWKLYVLTGEKLERLRSSMLARMESGEPMDTPEYEVYPRPLPELYNERRKEVGEDLYRLIGIARDDKQGRHTQFAKNSQLFGASVGVFAYIDRRLGPGQWMDLGMYLQNLMLLAESRGLGSCAQGYWSFFHSSVTDITQAPPELMLACGLALGYVDEEEPINSLRASRVPLEEFAVF